MPQIEEVVEDEQPPIVAAHVEEEGDASQHRESEKDHVRHVGGEEGVHLNEDERRAQDEMLEAARVLKIEGNELFGQNDFMGAALKYTEAIDMAPEGHKERSVFFNNRATSYFKLGQYDKVIEDCTAALKIDKDYVKCLLRRAQAYELEKKIIEAHDDFQRVLTLDAANSIAIAACKRLEKPAAEAREKQKEEMIGKLKELGNCVLGKFGMSLDNFKAVQDPNTGSYSISYNPGGA